MLAGLRIWHSTDSDRAQRKLLREALHGDLQHLPRVKEKGKLFADKAKREGKFILDKVDGISRPRNDAIHSPISLKAMTKRLRCVHSTSFRVPVRRL